MISFIFLIGKLRGQASKCPFEFPIFSGILACPQSVLFEGTDMEKRYRFEKVMVKTDDTFLVGTFNVDNLEKE